MAARFGLQARFLAMAALVLVLVGTLLYVLLQRQSLMQQEAGMLGRETMQSLVEDSLRRRGVATAGQVAEALANPLYYFDLDAMGRILRAVMRQPDIAYALVYDAEGKIVHDGSLEIAGFGQEMVDALAQEAVSADKAHIQWTSALVDVSEPILIGRQRIGGVRIGFAMAGIREQQDRSAEQLHSRLAELGRRHLGWVIGLMVLLAAVGLLAIWYMQQMLVRPIRRLADAARAIESGDYGGARLDSRRSDEVGELMRAFGRMRDSIARHDRDVRRMAYTDALTGLTNRLAFRETLDERLMQLRGAGRQLALLFADIDDFKRVNDTLGHEAGDDVLLQFANRIRETVERMGGDDALLARFGGDEFVILIQNGDVRASATRLAEELVSELGRPIQVQGRQVFLGSSIGITLSPEDASDATALMKNGDIAMYQAKLAGKNGYRFYSRAMDYAVERRVHMEQELRGAWERGELSLAYQPIFRLSDRSIVGAEVLLRWRHPELGMISPSVFIDVAEQSGLIESIGRRVLRAACNEAMRWNQYCPQGESLFVSVNLSSRQLRSGDLPEMVAECLRTSGLPAARLHLELTETAVMGDELQAASMLVRLHNTGVKVWLDDFGTGFSGLNHLRRVPVNGVKIDRSFIADLQRDPDDLALTTAIIAMAHSLGITVVAEGIERQVQYELLRERGCDLAQGYWLSYPVSAAEFAHLLATGGAGGQAR